MTARLCYQCGKKWTEIEGEPVSLLCPVCRYEEIMREGKRDQRDLAKLKEGLRCGSR